MVDKFLPFGMLFEETREDDKQLGSQPEFSPRQGISFITEPDGSRIPFVTWSNTVFGTKTRDWTKADMDDTDTDPGQD